MGETFQLGYNFGAWQILLKKQIDLSIFLSHMKFRRKIVKVRKLTYNKTSTATTHIST